MAAIRIAGASRDVTCDDDQDGIQQAKQWLVSKGLTSPISRALSILAASANATAPRLGPRQSAKRPEQQNHKNHRDHHQGERYRHNGLLAPQLSLPGVLE